VTGNTTRARSGRHAGRRLLVSGAVALGLLGLGPVSPATAAEPTAAEFEAMGTTHADDFRLAPGCHTTSYTYRVDPPEPEWTLEVFVTDAAGTAQASEVITSGPDATSGRRTFQLCASNTATGRFTIRTRLTYHHYASMPLADHDADYTGWLKTSHFRVTLTGKAQPSHRCRKARQKARHLGTAKARRAAHRACRR
jgi:hypothetical protein